ncbi:MAG: hypothetical protein COA96_02570 [SAR86 cluster bacterium]|uniref:FecR protein domain-containing protein n=1 Tax=SAR86 cluster bacterium TaxID=2030880 RepID=A0A2A5B836_9GAMM|nr:MAG: hypothetical protein COA96_02570 [SAR86 cluster bacterium]
MLVSFSVQAASDSMILSNSEHELVPVGEVSLVLGKAYLLSSDDSRQLIKQGTQIKATDRILTGVNGHVHIRFIDHALVSVRPNSQLEIVRYQYNAQKPEQSTIKFYLLEGVTRSVSGAGAKAARERFRLNTPIAAIGVRGTDFVVRATSQTTRALVNQGAIVVAPYSDDCTAAAFGPCASNAVELTDNSLQFIEMDGSGTSTRLIPASLEREPGAMRQEVQLALNSAADTADDTTIAADVYLDNVASQRADERVAATLPDFTPGSALSVQALTNPQLVWGRWADGLGEMEKITLSNNEAKDGRKLTVGNTDYVLYRTEGAWPQVDSGLGLVSFSLNSAQAFYNSSNGIVAMQVNGGSLDIDFEQSLFSTELNLNHIDTGLIDFVANGSISDRGYFNSRSPSQRIAGSVSQDGSEAGYFFQQQLESGSIQGLTLWDNR